MGWNSWNWFGKNDVNESVIIETIDAMVSTGLRDAGYIYVVIDGGWRDAQLNQNGELVPHPQKFPNGIKPLADYAHSKGMKLGLHTVPGSHDCGMEKVGGYGHEETHVRQFVDWGIDFIKLDKCRFSYDENPDFPPRDPRWYEGWDDEENLKKVYEKWGNLIHESGRDIIFNICAYKYREWYPETCHTARTTGDIRARKHGGALFERPTDTLIVGNQTVMEIAERNNRYAQFAGNGYWNDADMLATGEQGLTMDEQKAHFALWCIMSSPLFLGNDPREMSKDELDLIMNKNCIYINQDPTEQGKRISASGKSEIWAKKLSNGQYAVLLLNRDPLNTLNIKLDTRELGYSKKIRVFDIFEKKSMGKISRTLSMDVRPHSGIFLLLN